MFWGIILLTLSLNLFAKCQTNISQTERQLTLAASFHENKVDADEPTIVTLGPPRNGIQRALIDEVPYSNAELQPIDENHREIAAYDDNFVDPIREDPLIIPRLYRNETTTKTISRITTSRSFVSTSSPSLLQLQVLSNSDQLPRQQVPTQARTLQIPESSRHIVQQSVAASTPPPIIHDRQSSIASRIPTVELPTIIATTILPVRKERPQPRPAQSLLPRRPPSLIRPRPQPPREPPRINLPTITRRFSTQPPPAQNLRTGECRASIFYISAPVQNTIARSRFTHYAITISVDQCARTCHEFNCAVAHYSPTTGNCQFIPSTAFAVQEGQCPRWPHSYYRNNIRSNQQLHIFCIQCHRPFRRNPPRNRANRFRTHILRTHFTGRLSRNDDRSFYGPRVPLDSFTVSSLGVKTSNTQDAKNVTNATELDKTNSMLVSMNVAGIKKEDEKENQGAKAVDTSDNKPLRILTRGSGRSSTNLDALKWHSTIDTKTLNEFQ